MLNLPDLPYGYYWRGPNFPGQPIENYELRHKRPWYRPDTVVSHVYTELAYTYGTRNTVSIALDDLERYREKRGELNPPSKGVYA